VYGDKDLRKDHPVLSFLAQEGRCHSLQYFKDGCAAAAQGGACCLAGPLRPVHLPLLLPPLCCRRQRTHSSAPIAAHCAARAPQL
jgi:hypothetical protein